MACHEAACCVLKTSDDVRVRSTMLARDETCPVRRYRSDYTVGSLKSDEGDSKRPLSTLDSLLVWNQDLRPAQIRVLCIEPGDIHMPNCHQSLDSGYDFPRPCATG